MFFFFLLYFEKVWRKRNLNIENSLFGYNMIPEQGIFYVKIFYKRISTHLLTVLTKGAIPYIVKEK